MTVMLEAPGWLAAGWVAGWVAGWLGLLAGLASRPVSQPASQPAKSSANKHKKVRSALCWNSNIASLARQHNNANILSLPARFISLEEAKEIVDHFLSTDFEGGRHQRRIDKIDT